MRRQRCPAAVLVVLGVFVLAGLACRSSKPEHPDVPRREDVATALPAATLSARVADAPGRGAASRRPGGTLLAGTLLARRFREEKGGR